MSEWQECMVEEIAMPGKNSLSTGPFGSAISSKYFVDTGIPVIRGGNLSTEIGTRIIDNGFVFVTKEKSSEFTRSTVREGDIVFTCWGTINQIGLIEKKSKYSEYIISNKQMKLTPDTEKTDSLFLYYLFSSPEKQQEIINNGIGAAVPGFNLGQLRKMVLSLPALEEQKAIAAVLSSLDDKIDLLNRQNNTLETMAETLFRQWFIEETKEDWEEVIITDLFEVRDGTHDSPKQTTVGKPLITSKHILDGRLDIDNAYLISEDDFDKVNQRSKVDNLDILFSMIGTIGLTYMEQSININYAIKNIGLFKTSQNKDWATYTYLWLKSPIGQQFVEEHKSGSTQEYVSLGSLRSITFLKPPVERLLEFNGVTSSYLSKISLNRKQILILEKLRDTLLPKLMSGEVRVEV
jgi:type I restriction enzyme S subunit